MSDSSKKVFLSDIHLSQWVKTKTINEHDYRWFSDADKANLVQCLENLGQNEKGLKEIVILGDLFDTWVYPIDELPPSYTSIAKGSGVIDSLNRLIKQGIKVTYIVGNHDMSVTKKEIDAIMPGINFDFDTKGSLEFRDGRMVGEHGHLFSMFNAPDFRNDPIDGLPLGYYISRIQATHVARTNSSKMHFGHILKHLLDFEDIPSKVLDTLTEEAGLNDDSEIKIAENKSTTIDKVRQKYKGLYAQWVKNTSPSKALMAATASEADLFGGIGVFADELTSKGGAKIVLFGHSHESEIVQDDRYANRPIYANCGAWCSKAVKTGCKPYSLVVIETTEDAYKVSLQHWDDTNKELGYSSDDVKTINR